MKKRQKIPIYVPVSFGSFLIQSASLCDYSSLRKLALKHPLLNLPADPALLKKKIQTSEDSFKGALEREKRQFLFVIKKREKSGEEEVIGSSQIFSKFGTRKNPFYSLKVCYHEAVLQLKVVRDGPSYLGGLIVDEPYRGHTEKIGKQISLIRFLFAAICGECFESTLHAEVAPFLDEKGQNPFYEHFIRPRLSLSMPEIDYLTLTNKEKLFSSYPREKILFSSLPESVRKGLGKPGLFSQRAARLLEKQNFYFTGEVDPFDGGPYMQAQTKDIPLIKNTKKVFFTSEAFIYPKGEDILSRADNKSPKQLGVNSLPSVLDFKKKKKGLWAKMEKGQFTGGLWEAHLCQTDIEKEPSPMNTDFLEQARKWGIKKKDTLFITPFE
ncbi:MAG: arginine N-succinyltransferase [Bdellovibrionales bacterium]|nr:arginine N-succinyltransferase [Bdellovibrionales bacterium]